MHDLVFVNVPEGIMTAIVHPSFGNLLDSYLAHGKDSRALL